MVEVDQIGSKPDAKEEIEKWKSENCQCARCNNQQRYIYQLFSNRTWLLSSCLASFRYFSIIKPFGSPLVLILYHFFRLQFAYIRNEENKALCS